MALDLTGPRLAAESVLFGDGADECDIIRRPPDATRFQDGEYTVPAPILVYSGVCSAKSQTSTLAQRSTQGAVDAVEQRWQVSLPMLATAANPPSAGDVLIMRIARDGALDGARLVIRDTSGGSNSVLRRCSCDRWVPGGGHDWASPSP